MRIDNLPDAVRGQAVLYYRLPAQPGTQAPRRVQAVQQSSTAADGASRVATGPPDDSITLDLSAEGREAARKAELEQIQAQLGLTGAPDGETEKAGRSGEGGPAPTADERELEELSQKDRSVRAREQAVKAAAGSLTLGSASYSYEVGPDGRLYAIEGTLSFDVTEVPGDPEATLRKAEQIQQAANAPGEPSSQERAAAARAAALAARARHQMQEQEKREQKQP